MRDQAEREQREDSIVFVILLAILSMAVAIYAPGLFL